MPSTESPLTVRVSWLWAALIFALTAQAVLLPRPSSINLINPFLKAQSKDQCHRITEPGIPGLNPTNCRLAANQLCEDFVTHSAGMIQRDTWNYVELVGCAVSYNINEDTPIPTLEECEFSVFDGLIEVCGYNSSVNAGTVNVAVLPDYSQNGTAINDTQPMYMMAPERQTL